MNHMNLSVYLLPVYFLSDFIEFIQRKRLVVSCYPHARVELLPVDAAGSGGRHVGSSTVWSVSRKGKYIQQKSISLCSTTAYLPFCQTTNVVFHAMLEQRTRLLHLAMAFLR